MHTDLERWLVITEPMMNLYAQEQCPNMDLVVRLYLNPPDKALVLSLDEKSQIQALDRTQAGLPLKKGRCGTMTHDYPA